jgi:hypothetical protein
MHTSGYSKYFYALPACCLATISLIAGHYKSTVQVTKLQTSETSKLNVENYTLISVFTLEPCLRRKSGSAISFFTAALRAFDLRRPIAPKSCVPAASPEE